MADWGDYMRWIKKHFAFIINNNLSIKSVRCKGRVGIWLQLDFEERNRQHGIIFANKSQLNYRKGHRKAPKSQSSRIGEKIEVGENNRN